MKRIPLTIPIILFCLFTVSCQSVFIAEETTDRLFRYDSQSVFVLDKAAALQKRLPKPLIFVWCGNDYYYMKYKAIWENFANQRHDDLTVDGLLYLYKTSSNEKFRMKILKVLSYQKKERLILLWQEILNQDEIINELTAWNAVFGLATIDSQKSYQILQSLNTDPETPAVILAQINKLIREKMVGNPIDR